MLVLNSNWIVSGMYELICLQDRRVKNEFLSSTLAQLAVPCASGHECVSSYQAYSMQMAEAWGLWATPESMRVDTGSGAWLGNEKPEHCVWNILGTPLFSRQLGLCCDLSLFNPWRDIPHEGTVLCCSHEKGPYNVAFPGSLRILHPIF